MTDTGLPIVKALAAFQAEVSDPEKTKENLFHKNKYADLHAVFQATRKLLSKHGLAVTQTLESYDGVTPGTMMCLCTTIWCVTGGSISSRFPITITERDTSQTVAGKITYARRYALAAILGIASADEDDDGESAVGRGGNNQQAQQREQRARPTPPAPAPFDNVETAAAAVSSVPDIKTLQQVAARIKASNFTGTDREQITLVYQRRQAELASK